MIEWVASAEAQMLVYKGINHRFSECQLSDRYFSGAIKNTHVLSWAEGGVPRLPATGRFPEGLRGAAAGKSITGFSVEPKAFQEGTITTSRQQPVNHSAS